MEIQKIQAVQNPDKIEGSSKVTAIVDGIRYNSITPKIILNEGIFSDIRENIRFKQKDAIYPGINVIDIDWNGAVIDDKEINSTSDLLSLMSNMYLDIKNSGSIEYLWEDVISIKETYKLYYADEDNNLLTNYDMLSPYHFLVKENIAPKEAVNILVCDENDNYLYTLPIDNIYFDLTHNYGFNYYRVGLVSDIHHDDICEYNGSIHNSTHSGNSHLEYEDLEHAIDFFKNNSVNFIACAGDISTNSINQVKSFHNHLTKKYDRAFFTCKGNHDNAASYNNNEEWLANTMPSDALLQTSSITNLTFFESGDRTSFYFNKGNDIYIFFNVDYGHGGSTGDMALTKDDYNYDNIDGVSKVSTRAYHPDTIKELNDILSRNVNHRCFVFTHQPFAQKAGNVLYSYPNNTCATTRSHTYVLNGIQFAILNEMHNHYKNSIWFSGHTHYQWKWQSFSNKANICNWDVLNDNYNYNDYNDWMRNNYNNYDENYSPDYKESAYAVHIPSLSRPLRPEKIYTDLGYNDLIADPGSEAGIMDVYDDGVNIKGICFSNEQCSVNTEYNDAELLNEMLITANNVIADTSKSGWVEGAQQITQLEDGYIQLTFGEGNDGNCAQRYFLYGLPSNYIKIYDVKIFNKFGQNITETYIYKDNPYVGVYKDSGGYSLQSVSANNIDQDTGNPYFVINPATQEPYDGVCVEFPLSSQYNSQEGYTLPIIIQIKMSSGILQNNTVSTNTDYIDKYVSDANYWIPVPVNPTGVEPKQYEYFEQYVTENFNR